MDSKQVPSLLILIFLFVFVGIWSSPLAQDNDLYFHLKAGEWMLHAKQLMLHDVFTYTRHGVWEESAHSWLSNFIFYGLYSFGGMEALRLLNVFLVFFTLALLWRYVWRRTQAPTMAFLITCLALLLHQRYQILRPVLFGELSFAIFVFYIFERPLPWAPQRWGAALTLAILWANCHGSVVILPFIFTLWSLGAPGQKAKGMESLLSSFAILLATCINPWGIGLYRYAWDLSRAGRSLGGSEWTSSFPLQWVPKEFGIGHFRIGTDINQLILLGSLIGCLYLISRKNKRGDLPALLLSLFGCGMALLSKRHLVYLLFPLAHIGSVLIGYLPKRKSGPFLFPIGGGIALLFLFSFQQSYYVVPSIEKAVDFMEANGIEGHIFNYHAWGSYLIYRLHPKSFVALDARTLLHQQSFERLNALEDLNLEARRKILLAELPVNTDALLVSTAPHSLSPLLPPDWIQVFENNVATLALKRDNHAASIQRIQSYYQARGIAFDLQHGIHLQKAYLANPAWFEQNQETVPWGKWPVPLVKRQWALSQQKLFLSRQVPLPKKTEQMLSDTAGTQDGGVHYLTLSARQCGLIFLVLILGYFLVRVYALFPFRKKRPLEWRRS